MSGGAGEGTLIYVDRAEGAAFYLAFDLILARVPIEQGRLDTAKACSVGGPQADPGDLAYWSAVQATLMDADGFASDAESARRQARALEHGLDETQLARVRSVRAVNVRRVALRRSGPSDLTA